jgi:NADPH-dependent curcumin reductase CurA
MKLIRGVSRNKIRAVIDPNIFEGIESVADAVEHHNAGKNIGKVLIRLS